MQQKPRVFGKLGSWESGQMSEVGQEFGVLSNAGFCKVRSSIRKQIGKSHTEISVLPFGSGASSFRPIQNCRCVFFAQNDPSDLLRCGSRWHFKRSRCLHHIVVV